MTPKNKHPNFAVLREAMQQPALDPSTRQQTWSLMEEMAIHSPEEYQTLWIPYLSSFSHHFIEPWHTFKDTKKLTECAKRHPDFICFGLEWVYEGRQDDDIKSLSELPAASRLTSLDLSSNNRLSSRAARTLANSPAFANLRVLNLYENNIGSLGLCHLVKSPWLTKLKALNLFGTRIDRNTLSEATSEPWAFELQDLDLGGNSLSTSGVELLGECPSLRTVERLNLEYNNLDKTAIESLSNSPYTRSLKELCLAGNQLQDSGLKEIMRGDWKSLDDLQLEGASIMGKHLHHIQETSFAHNLRRLGLSINPLEDDVYLTTVSCFPNLQHLDLSSTPVSDDVVKSLATSPSSVHLTDLWLHLTQITSQGAIEIARSPFFKNLKTLSVWGTSIAQEDYNVLLSSEFLSPALKSMLKNHMGS